MIINTIIGIKINKLLKKQNKRQKDLSAYLGIKDNVVSYFVHGVRAPNIRQLIEIADFFDTTVDYLIGRSNIADIDIDNEAFAGKLLAEKENLITVLVDSMKILSQSLLNITNEE